MSLNLDVVINTPTDSVDMKAGLDTLGGTSDAARYIAEAILTGRVRERQTHKADVRTTLKQSFSGSYGQKFSIDIYDDAAHKEYRRIGKVAFFELMAYFLSESVYKQYPFNLSAKAEGVISRLGEKVKILTSQLRKSSLQRLHEVPEKFGYSVKIRYRQNREVQHELATFDRETAETIYARPSPEPVKIKAAITRLNINTGNGRLLVKHCDETVAFGFAGRYKYVPVETKENISSNLSHNNVRDAEKWLYLDIIARPIKLRDGKVVKYIITELQL
nr:hypothetical protein [Cupriavidus taiwanensis]